MTGVQVWSRVRLAEVADVASGVGFPTAYQGEKEGDFPFYKVSDMNMPGNEVHMRSHNNAISEEVRKKLRAKPFPAGSVIFPKIGAAIATNKKRVLTRPSCADNNVMAVIPRESVLLPEFLLYLFSRKNLSDFASDSNPPSIRKTEVEDWEISIPSVDEQRRIVDILNHAASIRRLREEARAKAREIIPALFVEMFGVARANPKGWPIVHLETVSSIGSGVTKGRKLDGAQIIEVPYLRVANVQDGRLNLAEIKTIPIRVDEQEKYALRPGDLVMTEGGDPDKLGRSAIWRGEIEGCAHQNHVFRVRPDTKQILPDYLCALSCSQYGKGYFLSVAKQTTGIASINKTQLGRFPVILPPLPLQQEFAARVAEVEGICALNDRAATAAEQMAQSLLAQVFGPAA